MTYYVENEAEAVFEFDVQKIADSVILRVLETEKCPYEVQVNVLLTDNAGIRTYNAEFRNIDRETDVLSFPNVEYDVPGDFSCVEEQTANCFDPDSGELILGDIIISIDRVREQAQSYGHSEKREFAFLVAHSMLHLCGYDHMEEDEAKEMEGKQEEVLAFLGITRED